MSRHQFSVDYRGRLACVCVRTSIAKICGRSEAKRRIIYCGWNNKFQPLEFKIVELNDFHETFLKFSLIFHKLISSFTSSRTQSNAFKSP